MLPGDVALLLRRATRLPDAELMCCETQSFCIGEEDGLVPEGRTETGRGHQILPDCCPGLAPPATMPATEGTAKRGLRAQGRTESEVNPIYIPVGN